MKGDEPQTCPQQNISDQGSSLGALGHTLDAFRVVMRRTARRLLDMASQTFVARLNLSAPHGLRMPPPAAAARPAAAGPIYNAAAPASSRARIAAAAGSLGHHAPHLLSRQCLPAGLGGAARPTGFRGAPLAAVSPPGHGGGPRIPPKQGAYPAWAASAGPILAAGRAAQAGQGEGAAPPPSAPRMNRSPLFAR